MFPLFDNRNVNKSMIQKAKKKSASPGEKVFFTHERKNGSITFFGLRKN